MFFIWWHIRISLFCVQCKITRICSDISYFYNDKKMIRWLIYCPFSLLLSRSCVPWIKVCCFISILGYHFLSNNNIQITTITMKGFKQLIIHRCIDPQWWPPNVCLMWHADTNSLLFSVLSLSTTMNCFYLSILLTFSFELCFCGCWYLAPYLIFCLYFVYFIAEYIT